MIAGAPACKRGWLGLGRMALLAGALVAWASVAQGQVGLAVPSAPPALLRALQAQGLPAQALALWVADARNPAQPRWQHRADQPVNPASVFKLVTSLAALEILGPTYRWRTGVWLDGAVDAQGVLHGNLVLRGGGDPQLVVERLWGLLEQVRARGVRRIAGDIVLDASAFAPERAEPYAFDGEGTRAYNVQADALLVNYHAWTLGFRPDAAAGVAWLHVVPPLAGLQAPARVPLRPAAPCGDWRAALQLQPPTAQRLVLDGGYPLACGPRDWVLADPEPASASARMVAGLWQHTGGGLQGQSRAGLAPARAPDFEWPSAPLADVLRDMNKFSNNVMAQQVFLTLALQAEPAQPASAALARAALLRWWHARLGANVPLVVDNGSGLSRHTRLSAQALGHLLALAQAGPLRAELVASLPLMGRDGTLAHADGGGGQAHIKTGSLRDVLALAGWVHAAQGHDWLVVAVVNHPQAQLARAPLHAWIADLVQSGP